MLDKKSGVYWELDDNSIRHILEDWGLTKESFYSKELPFRVRIDVRGIGVALGDSLPAFRLDEGSGELFYLDEGDFLAGSHLTVGADGCLLLVEGDG